MRVPLLTALAATLLTAALGQSALPADLPVTRLVLFTSGVGYFEHSGTVTGTQEVDLSVAADSMDDLLQSLVVEDLDGGSIRPVSYPSQDPLDRILAGYSLDLSGETTLPRLLQQARGEPVTVTTTSAIDGTIVGVENVTVEPDLVQPFLTLMTADGLQRVALSDVRSLRFADERVQRDLDAALATLARYRTSDDKTVTLRFEGDGTRRVRFGYVRAMPVWKTTYRLVLDGAGGADLQGWAIVDNPTNEDLEDVSIAFVAGRPVSFITNLYDPIYLQRPRVDLDLASNLAPEASRADTAPSAPTASNRAAAAPAPMMEAAKGFAASDALAQVAPQLSGAGVSAMAQGEQTGSSFSYRVEQPVSVPRHQSAMIPIALVHVPAAPLSIYDPSTLGGNPLRAVRLTNDSALHLAAGPVTVFDDGGYAGTARIADVVPGDDRIVTYAVDLGVQLRSEGSSEPERVTAVALRDGLLEATVRQRLTTTYTLDTRDGAARFVVLEHPRQPGYDVVSPSPAPAETATGYRFGVAISAAGGASAAPEDATVPTHVRCTAGEACSLEVVLERTDTRAIAVGNVSSDDIAFYLENVELSAEDRATLQRVLELKRQLADLDRQSQAKQDRVDAIFQDQNRIRQNMGALDRTSSLYRRYLSDLDAQESELDGLRNDLETLRGRRDAVQGQLDDLLSSLAPAGG